MEERQEEQEMEQMEEEGRVGRRFRGILLTMGGQVEGMLDEMADCVNIVKRVSSCVSDVTSVSGESFWFVCFLVEKKTCFFL